MNSLKLGLAGALGALDTENVIVPVHMEIKESADAGSKLYVTVTMTKKEAGVVGSTPSVNHARSLLPASTYRIAEIFAEINPKDTHFLKYVPDGFLDNAQLEAKPAAFFCVPAYATAYAIGAVFSDFSTTISR